MAHRRMQQRDDAGPHAALFNGLGLCELAVGNLRRSKVCRPWVVDGMLKVLLLRVGKVRSLASEAEAQGEIYCPQFVSFVRVRKLIPCIASR